MRNCFAPPINLLFLALLSWFGTSFSEVKSLAVQLSWNRNPERGIMYYAVYRDMQSRPSTEIAQIATPDTSYIDYDVITGNTYYYRITAVDSAGISSNYSSEVTVAVVLTDVNALELAAFSADVVDGRVVLFWTATDSMNDTAFHIERSQDRQKFLEVGTVEGKGSGAEEQSYDFIDAGATAGTYFYRIGQIDSNGIMRYSKILQIDAGQPTAFTLSQNYPNPFAKETTFSYHVANSAHVSLVVFDLLGRVARTLIDETKQPGRYAIMWDGQDDSNQRVVPGVYFAKLRAENFSQIRKIVVTSNQ